MCVQLIVVWYYWQISVSMIYCEVNEGSVRNKILTNYRGESTMVKDGI